jgi:hypothetical protein
MSIKTIVLIFISFSVLTVGMVFLFSFTQKTIPGTISFSVQDTDRPRAEATQTVFDFGEIKVSDIKQQDFTLKNTGSKPLQILNINSSCNCTFGQVIYKDLTSKEFGMHEQSGYVADIAPGDSASVRVTYKPAIMPVYGFVEREVYLSTNDPVNQRLVFSIKATVK